MGRFYTSPDGIKIGRWIDYDPKGAYKKKHLFGGAEDPTAFGRHPFASALGL